METSEFIPCACAFKVSSCSNFYVVDILLLTLVLRRMQHFIKLDILIICGTITNFPKDIKW